MSEETKDLPRITIDKDVQKDTAFWIGYAGKDSLAKHIKNIKSIQVKIDGTSHEVVVTTDPEIPELKGKQILT